MNTAAAARPVIFSDIDGTLIDHDYDPGPARSLIPHLAVRGVPLILCSAKTRAEQEPLRAGLGISGPFIVENGSAVILPRGDLLRGDTTAAHDTIELGLPAAIIRAALADARRELGLALVGYGDLSPEEVAAMTGLSLDGAVRAMRREYSETIVSPLATTDLTRLSDFLRGRGLSITHGGRFHTVVAAAADKGTAIRALLPRLRAALGPIRTIGIGDSANDGPLLAAVDRAYVVRRPDGIAQPFPGLRVQRVAGVGPAGWAMVVADLLAGRSDSRASG